jgi:hypothetical protein
MILIIKSPIKNKDMDENEFNNVFNEVTIISLREVKWLSLLVYARHHVTRRLMIDILRPFIDVLRDNDIVYFLERLLDEDNDMTGDIDSQLIRTIIERSENNRLGRVIDLIIERCKSTF